MKSGWIILMVALGIHSSIAETKENASSTTTDSRLQRLEQDVRELRDDNLKLQSELGLSDKNSSSYVRAGGKELTLKLGGLLQVQADGGDKGDVRFGSDNERIYLRRARMNAVASFQEDFEARVELELAGSLAEANALRAQLTDGYIQWKKYSEAQIRAGQFKTPYGYEQLAADPRLYTIERSLGNDRLTLSRQIGAQVNGDFLGQQLGYAFGAFNGTSVNSSSNDNSKFTLVGRLNAVPLDPGKDKPGPRLAFGINGYSSDDDRLSGQPSEFGFNTSTNSTPNGIFTGERNGWGADTQFSWDKLEIWAEYLGAQYEPDNSKPSSKVDAEAWYTQVAYYLVPKRLQAVAKYDQYDPDVDTADNRTDTWTFGLNYYIRDHDLKLQLNYLASDLESGDSTENKIIARLQAIF